MTNQSLSRLVELAKGVVVSEEDKKAQRRSFVYGNTAFENESITMQTIEDAEVRHPMEEA